MTITQGDPLAEIGRGLWLVDFMTSYIGDTGVHFEEGQGGDDETHQVWADAIHENYSALKCAVDDLRHAISQLPPEYAERIAASYREEDLKSRAAGDAFCLLSNLQQQIHDKKGGAA